VVGIDDIVSLNFPISPKSERIRCTSKFYKADIRRGMKAVLLLQKKITNLVPIGDFDRVALEGRLPLIETVRKSIGPVPLDCPRNRFAK
jgi:hypothetical protein